MKPLIIFMFWFTIVISINITTILCDDDSHYTNCNKAFSCGNSTISNLRYPFWGDNREKYCGDPGLEALTCEESVPKISINAIKYRILGWDTTTNQLTVARDDYWDNICVSDPKNNTFDNTLFQVDYLMLENVTLFYNCSSMPNVGSCTIVVIPIFNSNSALVTTNRVSDALDTGFGLKWTGNYEQCKTCSDSGGVCGFDGQFKCFCKDGPQTISCPVSGSSSKRNRRLTIAIGASTAGFGGVVVVFLMIICYHKRRLSFGKRRIFIKRRKFVDDSVEVFMKSYGSLAPKRYSYPEVKRITKTFLNKLGQGGYGVVYKATLSDGRPVAVKVINETMGNGEEFINEVASISRTSHVNIVSLLGFCYEMEKRALIYEFMPNGSLDNFIYKSGYPNAICNLDWYTLYQIGIGIARGLEYLHRGCNTRILHLDIKPQNILLDEDFRPKISDFGLAKICLRKESIVSILGTRGTIGYIAPEVLSRLFGGVSHKSDVYSYGMLILEMIGARKNYDSGGSHTSEMYFPDWIYKDLEQGDIPSSCLVATEEENEKVRKMTLVSLWCVQINPSDRPSMTKVVEMLEGALESVPYPPKPVLCSPARPPLQISDTSSTNMQDTNSITIQKDGSIELNELSKSIEISCGNIRNIGFPFWGDNRPSWCGHPSLHLICMKNISYITIHNVNYQVLVANPIEHTMKITRVDYLQLQGICPSKLFNTSLDTELFVYGSEDKHLTLFYGCTPSNAGLLPCNLNGAIDYVYPQFGFSPPPMFCKASVVVPVSPSLVDIRDFTNIQKAIRDGFMVKWIAGIEECEKCVKSDGICGYDSKSNQPTCSNSSPDAKAPPPSQEPPPPGMAKIIDIWIFYLLMKTVF
ncbi:LEAF RUST 10 DISEASE-RESISTANCE LOCUS RECEPTOR-LIKE PROTEIN KINASE-like 2.5 [Abrus precatorius]|uniref:non-specific serine/threonine protein kinase n=1 Tax=Abrus precatorius TaxID=3816 RepID=A0A8B8L5A1_ABRPR|nr:LEAF RUST 10 DISEASE-RESISTANCE LOCUS RECEPTOR-LIKE PROTEIN KINASE-like 2.5 [Abrus precatorius]